MSFAGAEAKNKVHLNDRVLWTNGLLSPSECML